MSNRCKRAKQLCAAAALACFLAAPALAYNPNSNRQIIPLGETEAFLGNTGTGRANDSGAVYYNPAGLALLPSGRVSVSGSVYLSYDTQTDGAFYVDQTTVGYEASGFNTVPAFYAATYRLDDWTGALSVLVPFSLAAEKRTPFTTPNTASNIVQTTQTNDLWIGLSAARELSERWSVGITIFGVQHHDSTTLGLDMPNINAPSTNVATSISQLVLNVFGLSATLGASYAASDTVRFGLRMQTPFVQLSGAADAYQTVHAVSGGQIVTVTDDHVKTPANYRIPLDFTLGSSWQATRDLTLLADVSLQLGANYQSVPASSLSEQVTLTPTPRENFGAELRVASWLLARTGFFYNPSADNSEASGTPGFLRENYYGTTFGVSFGTNRVQTGVGGFYVWSKGQMTPAGAPAGSLSNVSSHGLGALLNASYTL